MLEIYLKSSRESSDIPKQGKYRIRLEVYKNYYKCIIFSLREWAEEGKIWWQKYQPWCYFRNPDGKQLLNKEGTSGNGDLWIDLRDIYEIEFL